MSKIMQNLVVLMEPPEDVWNTSFRGGDMILNRFCIDEDAGFELSGIHFLKKSPGKTSNPYDPEFELRRQRKGNPQKMVKKTNTKEKQNGKIGGKE